VTPGDAFLTTTLQVAAVVIAGSVFWMARSITLLGRDVAVIKAGLEWLGKEFESIRKNYVKRHDFDSAIESARKSHENVSADFYRLREEHLRCRPCNEARDNRP